MSLFGKHPAAPQDWRSPFGQAVHKGGTTVTPPQPSEEEKALQREQLDILRENRAITQEQLRQQELLLPFLYEGAGITPQYGSDGKISGFTKVSDPNAAIRGEIESGLMKRTLAALRGELPVDAGLMRELGESEKTLRESLYQQLGPGYETSTPGIEALDRFRQTRTSTLDAARRGDLTMAEGLSIARSGEERIRAAELAQRIAGVSELRSGGVQRLGQVAQLFSGPLAAHQQQRQMQFEADIRNAAQRNKPSPWMQVAGLIGGAAAGSFFGGVGQTFGSAVGSKLGSVILT